MSINGPSFDRVYVISDLHMGGPAGRQIFSAGDRLAAFVDSVAAEDGNVALVINGDSVDFLAEQDAMHFDPVGALEKLKRIHADPAFNAAWLALEQLVAAGKTLVITIGNHDPELALPPLRQWLLDTLTAGDPTAHARVVLSFDGIGYRCTVGDRAILCAHGNEVDDWNVIDYGRLFVEARDVMQQRAARDDPWTVNAGTRMVIEVMNEVKRDYPFVDLLKPELEAVIPTLIAVKPKLIVKLLKVLGLQSQRVGDKRRIDRRLLTHPETELSQTDDELDAFARSVGRRMGEDLGKSSSDADSLLLAARDGTDDDADGMEGDELLGVKDYFSTLFAKEEEKPNRLRESLKNLLRENRAFDLSFEDAIYEAMDDRVSNRIDYVVTGHTHLIRAIQRSGGGYYFNSGTWIRLIELEEEMLAQEGFDDVWKAFNADTLEALDGTVIDGKPLVRVRPTGVRIIKDGDDAYGELFEVDPSGAQIAIGGSRMPRDV